MQRQDKKYNSWGFVINNPTMPEIERMESLFMEAKGEVTYLVSQHEVGLSGTYHLQGFLQTHNRIRMGTLLNKIGLEDGRIHLDFPIKDSRSMSEYCKMKSGETTRGGKKKTGKKIFLV